MILVYIKIIIDVLTCIDSLFIRLKELKKEKTRSSFISFNLIISYIFLFVLSKQNIEFEYISLYFISCMFIFLILIPSIFELIISFSQKKSFINFYRLIISVFIILFFIIYFFIYCFNIDIVLFNYNFKILDKFNHFDVILLIFYLSFLFIPQHYLKIKNNYLKKLKIKDKLEDIIIDIFWLLIVFYFLRFTLIVLIIPILI